MRYTKGKLLSSAADDKVYGAALKKAEGELEESRKQRKLIDEQIVWLEKAIKSLKVAINITVKDAA